ncbi:MAG TPA: deoxyguanosinetriphosphate triphosphohydrolase [Clostridiales bacterium]|nr:deoxyguanosinetriphosphate triphosphohydrolase [Clostridiales bacterium]
MKREDLEKREEQMLSPYAAKSASSRGRLTAVPPCPLRTEFQRDRDRIIHSKSFRRLKYKTQVFLPGGSDHYRTRLTHTLEVAQIGRTIARGLNLNEDLTEAIGLGHDLGHTPFGHAGERLIDSLVRPEYTFRHNEQSLRIVDVLEDGKGLNLTEEVRDGILRHTGDEPPFTLEGQVICFADRIAYVNHDIDDALRSGFLAEEDLPGDYLDFLGKTHSSRINALVSDIIETSEGKAYVRQSDTGSAALQQLRSFLFDHLYRLPQVREEEEKGCGILKALFLYYEDHPEQIPSTTPKGPLKIRVKDYVAGMTDKFAEETYLELFIPKSCRF